MMVILAAGIAASFGVCHACGAREDVSALFATSHSTSAARIFCAGLYVTLYLCFVVLMPVLVLAAGLFKTLHAVVRRAGKQET